MSTPCFRPGRASARLAAAVGAAALGLGAFAAPAGAQTFEPVEVLVEDYSPVYIGDTPELFGVRIVFGDDFAPGEHTVTATIEIDAPDNTFVIGLLDGSGSDCPVNEAHTLLSCSRTEAEAATFFQFRYAPSADAEPGVYDYTVTFGVDGETVETVEDSIELGAASDDPDSEWPYLHSDVAFTGVDPGDSVEVSPELLQDQPLRADAEAVVVAFGGPEGYGTPNDTAEVVADYDNCIDDYWGGPGVTCLITDFMDLPGKAFTLSDPITYEVAADAPGPLEICICHYNVYTATAEQIEARFGDFEWDPSSDNLLGLVETPGDGEYLEPTIGIITIKTTENPYDLAIADVNAKGGKDTETTVNVAVTNDGPAAAYSFFDGPGTYVLLGKLPTGLELVSIDDAEWICLEPADWEYYLPYEDPKELAKLDFVCFFSELGADETKNLPVKVKITGTTPKSDGTLEVGALENDYYPTVFDSDLKNNTAKFSVNASGSGKLPTTGTSMTVVFGAAAAALIAGVLLFVLTRRRKTAAEE